MNRESTLALADELFRRWDVNGMTPDPDSENYKKLKKKIKALARRRADGGITERLCHKVQVYLCLVNKSVDGPARWVVDKVLDE